jgi:hypothetical protein
VSSTPSSLPLLLRLGCVVVVVSQLRLIGRSLKEARRGGPFAHLSSLVWQRRGYKARTLAIRSTSICIVPTSRLPLPTPTADLCMPLPSLLLPSVPHTLIHAQRCPPRRRPG